MEQNTADFLQSVLKEIATRASMGAAYEKNWDANFARKEVVEAWKDERGHMRKARHRKVTVDELKALPVTTLRQLGFGGWEEGLTVIPLWAWNYIADGETLLCIDGKPYVKGKDAIDLDVRFGCIAFGFETPKIAA